jgi:site-specific DNA recombinase
VPRHSTTRPDRGQRRLRCAIYTRKSSEEGLEQDFNSLDAQREACVAFILSQKHEGWVLHPDHYDDGGYSGGTMERPSLKQLLHDIEGGRIDVVVVYKVDRLTRSLADFAKIVAVFDARGVSFVSVTQAFNTTSSMGRLTLNVLLSFAQFEREVTGERIRDKIAASKKKGMWMGGLPPLGYNVGYRKLILNAAEADTVRHIFQRYVELGSVQLLKTALEREGVVSKQRRGAAGQPFGGKTLARGALYRMLQNRIYRGEIVHKEKSYPADHPAIIDQILWDRVQDVLAANRVTHQTGAAAEAPSLLAGLLHDDQGAPMTPSHAVKKGTRYRYYVSRPLILRQKSVARGRRLPAADIEAIVRDRLRVFLSDPAAVLNAIAPHVPDGAEQKRLIDAAARLAQGWAGLTPSGLRAHLRGLVARIDVHADRVDIHLDPAHLPGDLDGETPHPRTSTPTNAAGLLTLSVPARLKRAGMEMKMIVEGEAGQRDGSLIKVIIKAHALKDKVLSTGETSLRTIATREGMVGSYLTRLLRLTFLAPDIITSILEGNHPPEMTARRLMRDTRLPLDWTEQRRLLGFV